jgi:pyruvate kinase
MRPMTTPAPRRATRIVATLGPASSTPEMIIKLAQAGADVFRLNFSHGKHEEHGARFAAIRAAEKAVGRPLAIVADLQGPKLRLGQFAEGAVALTAGQKFRLDSDTTPGTAERVFLPHPEILASLKPGSTLLLDDGKVRLRVDDCSTTHANCTVIAGNKLSDRKGVNVPDAVSGLSALTEKDRKDLAYALEIGVDYIALSFVQRPEDVSEARKLIGNKAWLISKIEKPSAVQYLQQIIDLSDALMVARGDLGVEMLPEEVPAIQKQMVRLCRAAGKPVIVATQMLESMITAPTPTRAEASDVANAVYDGTDAVMLSAETAAGEYPLEAITIMDRICRKVESDPLYRSIIDAQMLPHERTAADAITSAAKDVAKTIGAAAIVTYTSSGSTALKASRERPDVPVLCLTSNENTMRRCSLAYGIRAAQLPELKSFAETVEHATRMAGELGIAKKGERIVITAGVPFGTSGSTNILRIAWVE